MAKRSNSRSKKKKLVRKGRLEPRAGGLAVRMYRQGLGDCFLLAVRGKRNTRYVLIDCGVHSRQDSGPVRLEQVMDDIMTATGGRLDVIVATHEHADHLSGFVQKKSPFLTQKKLEIGELWVGWTEKVGDPQADRLRRKRGTARSVINKSLKDLTRLADQTPFAQQQRELLGKRIERFIDFEKYPEDSLDNQSIARVIDDNCSKHSDRERANANVAGLHSAWEEVGESTGLAAGGRRRKEPSKNELALALLASKADNVVYGEAGDVLEIPDIDNLRAYVLAPPRDERLLKKDKPSKIRRPSRDDGSDEHDGGKYKEVYLSGSAGARAFMYAPALGKSLPFDIAADFPEDMRFPFHRDYRHVSTEDMKKIKDRRPEPRMETKNLFDDTYFKKGSEWRRIDHDWLDISEQLALNLDSDTNNTSLVLAFEWGKPGEGQVLLFTGDAQVGNWLSWRRQEYSAGGLTMTADDLLKRVVLYKVGHHASHNATGRRDSSETTEEHPLGVPFGLELMEDIIAMIPIDRKAAQKNRPWEMPYTPLYRRLREKAHRRVLRSDSSLEPLTAPPEKRDVKTTKSTWSKTPGMRGVRWRSARKKFSEKPKDSLYYDVEFKP